MTVRYLAFRPNLPVADLDRAVRFYRDGLGLELRVEVQEMGLAILGRDGAEVALVVTSDGKPQEAYLTVEGVEEVHRSLKGGRVVRELERHRYGMYDFVVEDPDGNLVGVGERYDVDAD